MIVATMSHRAPFLARYGHKVAPLAANVFELLIAVLSLIAAITFFAIPNALSSSSIGQAFHPWDYLWNIFYAVGALAVIVGLWRELTRIEAAGLSLLTSAIAIAALGTASVRGLSAAPALATYLAAMAACGVRLFYLYQLDHAIHEIDSLLREFGDE